LFSAAGEDAVADDCAGVTAGLREVILSGTKGHRYVKVLAWNGIDPEG
jgi:hypothetical protein